MEEVKMPIYNFYATWNQDDYTNNGTGTSIMFKEEPSESELNQKLESFKDNIEKSQIEKGHPVMEWIKLEYQYYEHEVWMLNWFNHITYNQFETDEEVERSFRNFINRKKIQNKQNGHGETEHYNLDNKNPFYCFMGAEDRWRWKICRCEHCVAQGKITIDH